MMDQPSILIIDENHARAAIIQDGLREAGHANVRWLSETGSLLKQIAEIDPDVIVIDLESPNRDVLEQMFQVSRLVKRPVAMFVDQSDSASIREAMMAGVSAYVVDGLRKTGSSTYWTCACSASTSSRASPRNCMKPRPRWPTAR